MYQQLTPYVRQEYSPLPRGTRNRWDFTAGKTPYGVPVVGISVVHCDREISKARDIYISYALHFRNIVVESADMWVIRNEGKHVGTFREKLHDRQPFALYLGVCVSSPKRGRIINACILLLATVAENGRGVMVGCLPEYQKQWGARSLPAAECTKFICCATLSCQTTSSGGCTQQAVVLRLAECAALDVFPLVSDYPHICSLHNQPSEVECVRHINVPRI